MQLTGKLVLGESNMLFLQISKHSPESCPMHNEGAKKANMNLSVKMEQILRKYGIKMVGGWVAIPEHMNVVVFDAPSIEALVKAAMEPEMMAWIGYNKNQLMPVMSLEESMKLMK